ncbi:hypothetical protein BDB01DRAFT_773774, partial [Pilobolus umbonatus]
QVPVVFGNSTRARCLSTSSYVWVKKNNPGEIAIDMNLKWLTYGQVHHSISYFMANDWNIK